MNTGEQLLTEVVAYISELVPINVEKVKNELSQITAKYYV